MWKKLEEDAIEINPPSLDCISESDDDDDDDDEHVHYQRTLVEQLHRSKVSRAVKRAKQLLDRENEMTWRDSGDSPLKFWSDTIKENVKVKVLAPIVKALLSAPCVSSSSESVFSVAGDVLSKHRSKLSGEHAEMETIICRNLHLFESERALLARCVQHYLFTRG